MGDVMIEEIKNDLLGEKPVNWEAACAAYSIAGFKPAKLKILQRHELLKKLVSKTSTKEAHVRARDDEALKNGTKAEQMLRLVARHYSALENKGARLPKFSKWVTSLFKDDKDLAQALAKYCQVKGGDGIIISCNPVDILRAADTKHYWSCLDDKGAFTEVLPAVLEKCPGIAVAYVEGDDGKMRGRCWLHVVEVGGKLGVCPASHIYGHGVTHADLAKHIRGMGVEVYKEVCFGDNRTAGKYVGCFTANIHWDTYTWHPNKSFVVV